MCLARYILITTSLNITNSEIKYLKTSYRGLILVWRELCPVFGPDYSPELREEAWVKAEVCPLQHGEAVNPQEDLIMFCPTAPVTDVELNGAGTPRG